MIVFTERNLKRPHVIPDELFIGSLSYPEIKSLSWIGNPFLFNEVIGQGKQSLIGDAKNREMVKVRLR